MTYKELQEKLNRLNDEQLNSDVTVSLDLSEEAIAVDYFHIVEEDDMLGNVLDVGHPVLAVQF